MHPFSYKTKQKVMWIFAIGGALASFKILDLLVAAFGPMDQWPDGFGIFCFVFFGIMGIVTAPLFGAVLGLVAGGLVAMLLPKPLTKCPACGSTKAFAADRSFLTGRALPNRCPSCKHTW